MKVKFCGAAQTVTGSSHLITLDDGYTILMDVGLYQGRDEEFDEFNQQWLFDPSTLDCVILSHAHIDHCGRIPKLVADGFKGKIFCTSATRDLAAVMLLDSAKIQQKDARYMTKRNRKRGLTEVVEPLYRTKDAIACMKHFVGIAYDQWFDINQHVSFVLKDSGHIFGSASISLKIKEEGKEAVMLGFSGDIGRWNRPILRDPDPMEPLHYLICESTYGGVKHEGRPQNEDELLDVVKETCVVNRGVLIIPAFSVGRTQEIVYMLDRLETDNKLPKIPVYVDSPMAINATEVFRLHPECFDAEISKYMLKDPNPFGFNKLKYVRKTYQSKKLNALNRPAIIISASGMMNAGRICHHLLNHIENEKNTLLIIGYCAPHTTGARLRGGAKKIRIFGIEKEVRAKVVIVDSYSGHGDQDEMIQYISNQDKKKLKSIFLVHGDLDRQQQFKEALIGEGYMNVEIPELGQEFPID